MPASQGSFRWCRAAMEGHLGRYTSGDAGVTFAIAHAGIDRLVGRDLLVGIAVQYDRVVRKGRRARSSDDGPVAKVSADGWMAGPYLTARLDDRIYLDAGIGIGTATNRIAMTEGG